MKSDAPPFKVRQVVRPRVQVEEQLKEAILGGHFSQGDKLPPETELAERFGVSRPTVREALGSLASAGLIRKVPGVAGGSFVNSINPQSLSQMLQESVDTTLRLGTLHISELTQVRKVLEVPAARWAAEHRTDEQLAELGKIVERQRATTLDDPKIPDYDQAFHALIGDISGNRLLSAFISAVHGATHPVEYLHVTAEVAHETVKQHLAILAALEEADGDAAARAMETHLDFVFRYSAEYPNHHDEAAA